MSLTGLIDVVVDDPQLRNATEYLTTPEAGDADLVAPAALRPVLVAALAATAPFVLALTATAREAEDLTDALGSLLPDPHGAAYFPAWETLPHERLSPRSDTSGRRLAVLRRLAHPDSGSARSGAITVLVTPVRSLLQPMVSGLGDLEPVALQSGQPADFEEVIAHLVGIGHAPTDLVG